LYSANWGFVLEGGTYFEHFVTDLKREKEPMSLSKQFAAGLGIATALGLASSASALTLADFAIYSGGGSANRDVYLGTNTQTNGLVGSNRHIEIRSGAVVTGGIRAMGDLNPGGTEGTNAEFGDAIIAIEAIVNGNIDFGGQVYGDVHAGGNVLLRSAADVRKVGGVAGNVYAGGNLDINTQNPIVEGDAILGGVYNGNGTVQGTVLENQAAFPQLKSWGGLTLPSATAFASGGANIVSTGGDDPIVVVAPGSYGDLNLGQNRSLFLSSGDYFFDSIDTASGLDLFLDLSSGQLLNVFVSGDVDWGQNMSVFVDLGSGYESVSSLSDDAAAALVYFETTG